MKRYLVAAGALFMGTSTLALAADVKMTNMGDADAAKAVTGVKAMAPASADMKMMGATADKSLLAAKSSLDTDMTAKTSLLSNDKLAWNSDSKSMAPTDAKLMTASSDKGDMDWSSDAKMQTASYSTGKDMAWSDDAKLQSAAYDSGKDLNWSDDAKVQTAAIGGGKAMGGSDAKAQTASYHVDSDKDLGGDAKLQMASAGLDTKNMGSLDGAKLQTASLDKDGGWTSGGDAKLIQASSTGADYAMADKTQSYSGMGGPLEDGGASMASLTPQPAAQNYPACEPGPGDDRCIQLYEDGVRQELASWNRPTGGLLDARSDVAMGGPFEPVSDKTLTSETTATTEMSQTSAHAKVDSDMSLATPDTTQLAMNDASVAGSKSAMVDGDMNASAASTDLAQHSEYQGVGGPVESQSGYPPCSSSGPSEDRCIQLYEAGVSGAGN